MRRRGARAALVRAVLAAAFTTALTSAFTFALTSEAVARRAPPRVGISPLHPVPGGAPRPSAPVEIAWDSLGVPHIEARTRLDAYYGLGVALAHDRLWQMDYLRRRARGDGASMLGNDALRADGFVRLLGLSAAAERFAARQPDGAYSTQILDRFADGVNAGIALFPELSPEYHATGSRPRPWQRSDTIAMILAQGLTLDFDTSEIEESQRRARLSFAKWSEWTRYEPWVRYATIEGRTIAHPRASDAAPRSAGSPHGMREAPAAPIAGLAAARAFLGADDDLRRQASNAWVVAGNRAASGKPLLANDPHLDLTTPSIWYCAHLFVADSLNVAGVLVPGVPLITSGRNAHVAWGITALGADVVDYTTELLSPDGTGYRVGDAWQPLARNSLGLRYKLGPLSLPVPVSRRMTRDGVLLMDDMQGRRGYAVRWAPLESAEFDCAFLGAEDARSADELRLRLRHAATPTLNLVAADDAGHIVYQTLGLLPRRDHPAAATPAPGWIAPIAWQGFLPADSLLATADPVRGYLVSANNAPCLACDSRGDYSIAEYRARRIAELLDAETVPMTLADMARIQLDVQSPDAREFLPRLLAVAGDGENATPRERQAIDRLTHWDRNTDCASIGATLFRAWWGRLASHTPAVAHRGLWARVLEGNAQNDWWDDPATPARETGPGVVSASLREACDALAARFGADMSRWQYGAAHRAHFAHPLEGRAARFAGSDIDSPGDPHSVRQGSSGLPSSVRSTHASSWRVLVDLADPEVLQMCLPPGNGAPAAAVADTAMLQRWAGGVYAPLHLRMPAGAARINDLRIAP